MHGAFVRPCFMATLRFLNGKKNCNSERATTEPFFAELLLARRLALRARIVLQAAVAWGRAGSLGVRPATVSTWRTRSARAGGFPHAYQCRAAHALSRIR